MPGDWKQRRREILDRWNGLMGAWPPLLKEQEMKVADSVHKDGFTQYRVRFLWTPKEETEGYLLVPDGKGKRPAVITVYYEPETAIGVGDPDQSSHVPYGQIRVSYLMSRAATSIIGNRGILGGIRGHGARGE